MKNLAVTIKWNGEPKDEEFYRCVINYLGDNVSFSIIENSFELDSNGKLHYHGLWTSQRVPYVKKLIRHVPGVHLYMKSLNTEKDVKRWLQYIRKETAINNFSMEEYYKHNYGFIDSDAEASDNQDL